VAYVKALPRPSSGHTEEKHEISPSSVSRPRLEPGIYQKQNRNITGSASEFVQTAREMVLKIGYKKYIL
jgi:hypothetical protein